MNYPPTEAVNVSALIFQRKAEEWNRRANTTNKLLRAEYCRGRADGLRYAERRMALLKKQLAKLEEAIYGNG